MVEDGSAMMEFEKETRRRRGTFSEAFHSGVKDKFILNPTAPLSERRTNKYPMQSREVWSNCRGTTGTNRSSNDILPFHPLLSTTTIKQRLNSAFIIPINMLAQRAAQQSLRRCMSPAQSLTPEGPRKHQLTSSQSLLVSPQWSQ
jgi:hypothetical protein